MKKTIAIVLVFVMAMVLFPAQGLATGSAKFSISGPSTLSKGQTGTYTVKVSVSDAAAAQATLKYDSSFFQLVSGNKTGVWDSASNTSTTVTLTTVTLKCIADEGTSGSLSLSKKASRLTGDPEDPVESVSCSGGSKTVSNPEPEPTATPSPVSTSAATTQPSATATSSATKKPTSTKKPTATSKPAATSTQGTPTPEPTATPTPAPTQPPWTDVEKGINEGSSDGTVNVKILDDPQVPGALLGALKGKQSKLILEFDNYTCIIDGSVLNEIPLDLSTLDLTMSMEIDESLSAVFGGKDAYQLHFNYHGELPGKITFKIKAENSQPGDTVYLYYYYDTAGVIEAIQTAVVDEDGYITFEIYHCSDYVITSEMIEGAAGGFITDNGVNAQPGQTGTQSISLLVYLISIAVAIAGASYLTGQYNKKKEGQSS